ncbi:unnamed protein product [Symbiodinium natans]|uniref:Uncharacterized protein n=1 Tax=Symbiodinium natans TaxID=878477 RepID=A0A812LHU8_9DINO|nr:unnamed protein product [Symbiodinium natans]
MDDEDTHLLAQLRVLCREESVAEARGELAHLIQAGLPPKPPKISKLLHLALRRDVWALQACRPAFGISQVPPSLQLFRSFDKVLTDCLKDVVRRTEQKSRGLPLHSLAGPWEGGHEAAAVENARPGGSCAQAFAAWNAQGAFGRSANEARNVDRMLHFAAQLLHAEVTIAVVAEPKLGEHASWPSCTGFKFFGLHTHDPASVAVLVHEAVAHAVSVLSDYGDECASWVAVEGQPMVLLLAVYGPHTGHPNQFRQEFWYKRLREYHSIRCLERYKDCPLTILGDTNLHFPFLGPTNQRMARPLDRQILSLFESPAAFHTTIRNLPSVATHASGSVIDLVAAQESLSMDLEVTWLQEDELRSDHAFVVCRCRSASIPLLQSQHVGVARWGLGAAWDEATDAVKSSLSFASAWAACALGDTSLRDWVSQGKFKRARLNLLDRVVWWRSVLLTLAGHFKGLVWLQGTRQPKDLAQELWPFMAADLEEEGGSEAAEDLLARLKSSLHEEKVARFTKLSASNQQEAQAYLSRLLKPKEQLQTKLCEKGTGRPLSDFETLAAIADDVIARGHAGHEGVPAFDACIQSMVAQARTTALASSLKAVVAGSEAGRALTWAIINLIFFIGLVVTKQECLRPICYVSDLEGAFDMVWLHLHKQLLIDYAGSEQVGGQTDPVLVSIGFLISLRSRLNSGLPSLLMKADLLQGYDLAWRDWPETLTLPILDGEQIRPVQQLEVLGTSLDKSLSLEAGLSALGQRLHDAGIANLSLGDGGYSLMLTWLGYQWRLSAKVGLRIVTALARLLTLPPHSLLHEVVRAAAGVTGETWVESARGVARSFGVETIPSWETLPSTVFAKADVKLFIQNWKRACVIPAISAKERLWQQEARSKWPRNPPAELRQALSLTRGTLWTPRLARACKAWFLALLTGRIFLGGWHRGDTRPDSDQRCWLCESRVTDLCDHLESQCEVVERVTASAGLQRPGLFSLPEDAPRLRRRIETLDCIMTAKQD